MRDGVMKEGFRSVKGSRLSASQKKGLQIEKEIVKGT
jgi:hypothetical protein